ncbi:type II CRISPR RNA-guided endonuclease Cas9 [Scardovia wiggsiae]|uniref:type II CRISPR RNA-guided endonuclease Cas9 n=1 Tax=Scardovia wiggsiae TaxID=230143 RepID=UPI00374EB1D6
MGYKAPRNDKGEVDYGVGLDLGNGSVGWVAMDKDYHLIRARGNELIGARLFHPANTAKERRTHRTTRRRYSRRRWRLRMLDSLFASELAKVDLNFLARRKYSWVHPKDEQNHENWYGSIIFGSKEQDKQFYKDYPTIYHLRKKLMEDTERHDIREIYVAIHHIVKFRGNFLREGDINTEHLFNVNEFIELIKDIVGSASSIPVSDSSRIKAISDALLDEHSNRRAKIENTLKEFNPYIVSDKDKKVIRTVITAVVGNNVDFSTIFDLDLSSLDSKDKKKFKFKFSDSNFDEEYEDMITLGYLDDDQLSLVNRLHLIYDSVTLRQILGDSHTLSEAKIKSYNEHHENWELIKKYLCNINNKKEKYSKAEIYKNYGLLLGWEIDSNGIKHKLKNKNGSGANEYFKKLINSSTKLSEKDKTRLGIAVENNKLFPIQRYSDNGVIPYQIHLKELHKIIENQKEYYPFLAETFIRKTAEGKIHEENKIVALLKFRVPYYVGPLVSKEDMEEHSSGNSAYHWMARNPGRDEAITPWNFDEVVDKDESGAQFISRLTGTDTYLFGEPTLPKHSLLYEKYMMLNELNNIRVRSQFCKRGDFTKRCRLSKEQKDILINKLFKEKKTVTKENAENQLDRSGYIEIFGLSDGKKFTSSLSSYITLKEILGVGVVDDPQNFEILEKIIEIQTVFEDKASRKRQLALLRNTINFSDDQLDKLVGIHYTGWGRLSKKLLTSKVYSQDEPIRIRQSMIDVMHEKSFNLVEIIHDNKYGFGKWIDRENLNREVDSPNASKIEAALQGAIMSPKVKRGVTQAIRIVDDITKAIGNPPQRIFIEMADEVQRSHRIPSRFDKVKDLYDKASLSSEFEQLQSELESQSNGKQSNKILQDDRLYLYYIQLGKDMYTGDPINIDAINSEYDIDHIVPQVMTKDDSIDNRVLVSKRENARKSDSCLYTEGIIDKRKSWWEELLRDGFMSQKKYDALTRRNEFNDHEKKRFVQRSLVETRQIMKNVSTILRTYYGEGIEVMTLKSSITHDMRRYLGYSNKSREINDYHHAQDALCIAAAGQFMINRQFFSGGKVMDRTVNAYNIYLQEYLREARRKAAEEEDNVESSHLAHKSHRMNPFGFVVASMASEDESRRTNRDTGEIVWSEEDANYLRRVMNYKKMLVTRKHNDNVDRALYKDTRCKSGDSKKYIPLDSLKTKTNLYGGFSEPSTSYTMLVERDNKAKLVTVTAMEASLLENSDHAQHDALIRHILVKNKLDGAKILLKQIPSGQLIEYHSNKECIPQLMMIQSATEFNNAEQLWLDRKDYDDLAILLSFNNKGGRNNEASVERLLIKKYGKNADLSDKAVELFKKILLTIDNRYPYFGLKLSKNKVEIAKGKFSSVKFDDIWDKDKKKIVQIGQQLILIYMLAGLHAGPERSNLVSIGLPSEWGRVRKEAGFTLSDSDTFIYQSPSGIFEQRVTVKELKEKADKRK